MRDLAQIFTTQDFWRVFMSHIKLHCGHIVLSLLRILGSSSKLILFFSWHHFCSYFINKEINKVYFNTHIHVRGKHYHATHRHDLANVCFT
jgi:hypothetical protein